MSILPRQQLLHLQYSNLYTVAYRSRLLMSKLQQLGASRQVLEAWILRNDFKGWDPFDALRSPILSKLTFGSRRLGQILVQLLKRSPINLRPLVGVQTGYNPKAMGLFLSSYLRKAQISKSELDLEKAHFFSNWLQKNRSEGFSGYCWGYNFDWPNRGFFAFAGTPTSVNTAFIGLSFLDMFEYLKTNGTKDSPNDKRFTMGMEIARSACDFFLNDLNILENREGTCFSYTPWDHRYVHNANVLAASLIAKVGQISGESRLFDVALSAARYTVHHQRANGEWLYGEGEKDQWVDNFHTGYVLVSLRRISKALLTNEFDDSISRGYSFWKSTFIHSDGSLSYYSNRKYPVDIHAVSQSILTLLEFSEDDPEALELAWLIAVWAMKHMQDSKGFFYFQLYPRYINKIAYMRWAQAWMFKSLIEFEWKMQ